MTTPTSPQVGVGTSTMQYDMVKEGGYQRIVNVDFADVCVKRLAELHASVPQLEYLVVGDAQRLDVSFDIVQVFVVLAFAVAGQQYDAVRQYSCLSLSYLLC